MGHNVPEKSITSSELPSHIANQCLKTVEGVRNITVDRAIPMKIDPVPVTQKSVDPVPFLSTETSHNHSAVTTHLEVADVPMPTPIAHDSLYIPASSPPVSEPDDGVLLQENESEDSEAP